MVKADSRLALQSSVPTVLRLLQPADSEALAQWYRRNKDFHTLWSPLPSTDVYHAKKLLALLELYCQAAEKDLAYSFGIFLPKGDIIGTIALTSIERDAMQSAKIGYALDKDYCDKGIASASLQRVLHFAFHDILLERIEAATLPENLPSRRVLEKNGFRLVGSVENYLPIQGIRRTHYLYSVSTKQFSNIFN